MKTIGFIGGGRVTRIFLNAFRNNGLDLDGISVYDPNPMVVDHLKERFPAILASSTDQKSAATADLVFLAVHPPVMMECLATIKPLLNASATVVSLAPKFTIGKIASVLTENPAIARINPSASTWINQGINPICFASGMSADQKEQLLRLMEPIGKSPEVEESKIEAYAMISAMGHTYFWFQIQRLKDLAIGFGMNSAEAETVIAGMMDGTVETLFHSGLSYPEVIDLVPVKPLGPVESMISAFYDEHLVTLYNKIKP
jgi:pyrroline-5-carboxylate reductase